ncbi:hypothetical protein [Bradyrhizobium mercantei]|uniref:hypothetical protein n=1 Tax=Bradyrhizobium mercantei TaxID=1904807 RepID=UPI000976E8FD|nr:hypothetical protein [Bradyrhizobium mercantei]
MADKDTLPSFDEMPSFDDIPDGQQAPQPERPLMFDDLPSFDDMPDSAPQRPQAESKLKTFGREAAHGVLPAVGGIGGAGAGVALGTAAAPFLGPLAPAGPIIGGLLGMIGGSTATDKAQSIALDAIGFNDDAQRAANARCRKPTPRSQMAPPR